MDRVGKAAHRGNMKAVFWVSAAGNFGGLGLHLRDDLFTYILQMNVIICYNSLKIREIFKVCAY